MTQHARLIAPILMMVSAVSLAARILTLQRDVEKAVRGQNSMTLLAALGAWLGWQPLPQTLLLASASGLVWTLLQRLVTRRSLEQPLAFGPWLALAGGVALHAVNVYIATTILPSVVRDIDCGARPTAPSTRAAAGRVPVTSSQK